MTNPIIGLTVLWHPLAAEPLEPWEVIDLFQAVAGYPSPGGHELWVHLRSLSGKEHLAPASHPTLEKAIVEAIWLRSAAVAAQVAEAMPA